MLNWKNPSKVKLTFYYCSNVMILTSFGRLWLRVSRPLTRKSSFQSLAPPVHSVSPKATEPKVTAVCELCDRKILSVCLSLKQIWYTCKTRTFIQFTRILCPVIQVHVSDSWERQMNRYNFIVTGLIKEIKIDAYNFFFDKWINQPTTVLCK